MQRLTEWTGEQWIPVQERLNGKIVGHKTCMERLAAYENTGLEPAEIMDGKMLTGWIPVEEQLPETGVSVLITTDGGDVDVDFLVQGVWFWGQEVYTVIAWMPMPEPYKHDN